MLLKKRPVLLIAGPCSAETRDQTLLSADELIQNCNPDIFRAGVWKSRTNINSFEGSGKKALKWLSEVKSTYGIPVATEILTPGHVELCLKENIDYLWLGARTVANPYIVKEICEALKGVDHNILVKNPINPDIKLWIGAIERVRQTGAKDVMAIHRGFSTYYNYPYRNMPLWDIPIELKRNMPDLPIICDPSHICGKKICLQEIMQQALDLEMDGLMVETHPDPEAAMSDSEQQIRAKQLQIILSNLIIRMHSDSKHQKLMSLRNEIDLIDDQLLETLARRMHIIVEIGKLKKENKITILQAGRSRHLFADRMMKGNDLRLNPDFLKNLLKTIHNEAIRIQMDILNFNVSDKNNSF